RLARHESPDSIARALSQSLQYLDNGMKKVPSMFLEPVPVTGDNMMSTVVADGWHSMEKVYANIPKDQWPKK
ncbi:MAG: hypothetical protein ABI623_06530, partial [bacterium]